MTSILKTDEIQSQNGGSVVKMQTLKHPSASANNLVLGSDGSATINQISSSTVFPAGHIVQSVFNPTITIDGSNITTEANVASVTNQITITSGNGVLIFVQAGDVYLDRNSGDMGYKARIREGVGTSGAVLSYLNERHTSHPSNWNAKFQMMAYDSSPADTTPDYSLTLERFSTGAHYVRINTTGNDALKIYLFEVKQ